MSGSTHTLYRTLALLLVALFLTHAAGTINAAPSQTSWMQYDSADARGFILGDAQEVAKIDASRLANNQALSELGLRQETIGGLVIAKADDWRLIADQVTAMYPMAQPDWQVSDIPSNVLIADNVATNALPNDPQLSEQWALGASGVRLVEFWGQTSKPVFPRQVKVVVIDTGCSQHPDLTFTNCVTRGWSSPDDQNGHGTHVAGIIDAETNNGEGVAGVGWGANIELNSCRALGAGGTGFTSDVVACIEWADEINADVINLSLSSPNESSFLQGAIDAFEQNGIAVCASGNNGPAAGPNSPARYCRLAVRAYDEGGNEANFSNRNGNAIAPGVSVLSTYMNVSDGSATYAYLSGTSMATPHIAGLAALVWASKPSWTADQVTNRLLASPRTIGGVPAPDAVELFTQPADTTPPAVTGKTPAAGASGAPINTIVQATFSEPVTGVSNASFTLSGPNGAAPAAVSISGNTATLDPSSDLAPGTIYTARLTSGVTDAAGNALQPVTWSFTTATSQSTVRPLLWIALVKK